MIKRLNKYGFCLEPNAKYTLFDEIGSHFLDRATQLLKSGMRFVYVLDNIDWVEKVHEQRSDKQNKDVHAVASSIVFCRVPSDDLPDDGPKRDLHDTNVRQLIELTDGEKVQLRQRYRVLVAQILFKHFPFMRMFQPFVPAETECAFPSETAMKTEVVTMPILMKDEKKYSECVEVLDQLEKWTEEIYTSAGLCQPVQDAVQAAPPLIGQSSRPDQPASHCQPVPSADDPLSGIKIPCFGDQLTRVRLAGAKDLRAGCHSAKERLDHLYPFCIVDWHTKRSYLKVQYLQYH